jgi:undecaprenyl diphosphate synthase
MANNSSVPNHLGLILDGNRRWAKEHNLSSLEGHQRGADNLKVIARHAINSGVNYVSAYIFSLENWNRSKKEVNYLMRLAYVMITRDVDELNQDGVRIVWLGSKQKVSKKLLKAIAAAEELTKNNKKGTLCICFNYSGYQEIVDAFIKIIDQKIPKNKINIDLIEDNLYGKDIPKIDFLIRTSGEHRISNFMLWRINYAELYFVEKHWPGFSKSDLDKALKEYSKRERRFGR